MITEDTGIRIDFPMMDHTRRKETVVKECYMILYPTYIQYKVVADYEELDGDTELWIPVKANHRYIRKKETISGIDMYFSNRNSLWSVEIEFNGVAEITGWLYADPKEALAVFNKLKDYMIR